MTFSKAYTGVASGFVKGRVVRSVLGLNVKFLVK
jgi:hypothetical protein